ncbi:MAG: rRNA maturation RNase YbeY [Peptostreptococcus stomatis]|uniref:rRNA maturation RNase YbeY n=1 Tax=Peptostreptococcus stomatis TaxID=341694 RepID=UPI001A457905|nr:rRNA maturation RNase YbeY [Peptostreptococcus stomatis]MBL6465091.1 rRNA maturation RNase YbeY [Peptostreptococcus stomatis]
MEIIFEDRQNFAKLDQDIMDKIEAVILKVLAYEGYDDDYEVSLSFVSNDEIREINRDYRNIDKVTDVLSFPMYDGEEVDVDFGAISLGDIVISIERAADQARDFGHSLKREVCFLVCHSMFHLLGYDHMEEEEAKEMHAKEEAVLSQLGITRN